MPHATCWEDAALMYQGTSTRLACYWQARELKKKHLRLAHDKIDYTVKPDSGISFPTGRVVLLIFNESAYHPSSLPQKEMDKHTAEVARRMASADTGRRHVDALDD